MNIISIIIILAILVLVITIITRPLFSTKIDNIINDKTADLNTEYQQTLNRIRELEQEYLDGKLDQLDYKANREKLNQDAAQILEKM